MNDSRCAFSGLLLHCAAALLWSAAVRAGQFEDISASACFDAPHSASTLSTGIAVADFDRNGLPDVFVTGDLGPNRLFLNRGPALCMDPVSLALEMALPDAVCKAAAAADFDNDGWPDLAIACLGQVLLFRNLGESQFQRLGADAGLEAASQPETLSWADLNGDGWLDLVVGVRPLGSDPADPDEWDHVYLGQNGASFGRVEFPQGQAGFRPTLAALVTDFDADGLPDIYFVNDRLAGNVLWRNGGPGCDGWCFEDISAQSGADRPVWGMGVGQGDYDRDGRLDLYVSSIAEQVLLRRFGAPELPSFVDVSAGSVVNYDGVGWSTIFLDADNDGWEDLFLAVSGSRPDNSNRLFGNATGSFSDRTEAAGLDDPAPTMAAARIDLDRDGQLDLVLGRVDSGYRLMRNTGTPGNHWIGFRLEGGAGVNRDAIGSRVELIESGGGRQIRVHTVGESRASNHDPLLHFGLGEQTVAGVVITWPDGWIQMLGALEAGRYHHVVHPRADPLFRDSWEAGPTLHSPYATLPGIRTAD